MTGKTWSDSQKGIASATGIPLRSKDDACSFGHAWYFEGKRCGGGHYAHRSSANSRCLACMAQNAYQDDTTAKVPQLINTFLNMSINYGLPTYDSVICAHAVCDILPDAADISRVRDAYTFAIDLNGGWEGMPEFVQVRAYYVERLPEFTEVSQNNVEQLLKSFAYTSIEDVCSWTTKDIAIGEDADGHVITQPQTTLCIKDSSEIGSEAMRAIKSIKMTKFGASVEMYDKFNAIEMLSRRYQLFAKVAYELGAGDLAQAAQSGALSEDDKAHIQGFLKGMNDVEN